VGGPASPAGAARLATPDPEPEGRRRPLLPILGAVVALAVVAIVAVVLLTGGDDPQPAAQRTTSTAPAASSGDGTTTPRRTPVAVANPSTYTVSVLNGTAVPGLARNAAERLRNAGWSKQGVVTNASDQTRTTTLIEYAAGRKREALAVAKALDVGASGVRPLSPGSRTIAGEDASVVVTVGSDQYTSPQQ
jgi:hypothetical protein